MIEMAKRTHWEEFLQSVDDKTVWSAHHYAASAPSDGGKARVPTLCLENQLDGPATVAASNKEKTNTFMKTFFSSPEPVELDNSDKEYLPQKFPFSTITNMQIKRAISRLSPYKALGPDGIPNAVFIQCAEL